MQSLICPTPDPTPPTHPPTQLSEEGSSHSSTACPSPHPRQDVALPVEVESPGEFLSDQLSEGCAQGQSWCPERRAGRQPLGRLNQ